MFLDLNLPKKKDISERQLGEKYLGQEKKIYQELHEYIQEREEKEFISEEEFLSNTFLQNKYRKEYAAVMEYLDNLELTPGQEALGMTKEELLHQAVLDYTTVAGAIKMTGDKEQERRFKEDYDLNRFIRLDSTIRLDKYKNYQKPNGNTFSLEQDIDDKLTRMILQTEREYRAQENELDAMFNSINEEPNQKGNHKK